MKRNQVDNSPSEPNKKIKTLSSGDDDQNTSIHQLTIDELSQILQFLPISGVLMFSLTSKLNYQLICDFTKNVTCKYFVSHKRIKKGEEPTETRNWSLASALKQIQSLAIDDANKEQIKEFALEIGERNGSLCEISRSFYCFPSIAESMIEILDIRKKNSKRGMLEIETVDICFSEPPSSYKREVKKTIIESGEPLGFDLLEFNAINCVLDSDFLKMLTKMRNLEKLQLEYGYDHNLKNSEKVAVPIMKNLKTIEIYVSVDDEENAVLMNLLLICPNLENLEIIHDDPLTDKFLEALSEACPNLKKLDTDSIEGGNYMNIQITDLGLAKFLEKCNQLTYLNLQATSNIDGSIFNRLGDFPNLRYFTVDRTSYYIACEEHVTNVKFGGNPNPFLEYVNVGTDYTFNPHNDDYDDQEGQLDAFITSLKSVAPNLKRVEGFKEFCHDKVIKLYSNSLEFVNIDCHEVLELLDVISLIPNLKKVEISTEFAEISENSFKTTNPNVETLYINTILTLNHLDYLCKLFPNVTTIEMYYVGEIREFLSQSNDHWPHLRYLEIFNAMRKPTTIDRPNLLSNLNSDPFFYFWLYKLSSTILRNIYILEN